MEILIITGLSGGGKSRAASYLEDIGYYTVDNLPAEMMVKFADFCAGSSGRYDRVALVYDVRSGEPTDILIETLERLKASGVNCRMLFLEADNQTIVNRYKETRRMHPLQKKGESVEQAIRREREWMQPVRDHADFVLDTSALSIAKLRSELLDLFAQINRQGQTILMVTHSVKAASHAGRVLFIKDGQVFHQLYHGIEKKRGGGTIRVCADVKDGCLVVQVADDGCGMTPEKLEEVQREVAGDLGQISEGGFGLPNIQKRIQLAYGADYGIHVSSRLGCGTRVTLQIPAKS